MIRHKLRELIDENGLTYSKFARKTGLGTSCCQELYRNPYAQMKTGTIDKCLQFFEIPVQEFLIVEREQQSA